MAALLLRHALYPCPQDVRMPVSATFAMLKPDVTQSPAMFAIRDRLAEAGFTIALAKAHHLTIAEASAFYAEHQGRPFFDGLVQQMSSAPVIAMVLTHPSADAVSAWRSLLGATNPTVAAVGTLRREFGTEGAKNAAHGSDSPASARREAEFFFGAAVARELFE